MRLEITIPFARPFMHSACVWVLCVCVFYICRSIFFFRSCLTLNYISRHIVACRCFETWSLCCRFAMHVFRSMSIKHRSDFRSIFPSLFKCENEKVLWKSLCFICKVWMCVSATTLFCIRFDNFIDSINVWCPFWIDYFSDGHADWVDWIHSFVHSYNTFWWLAFFLTSPHLNTKGQ